MSPRMRPSSTRKSTPSSATVVPNALRKPRASMHGMVSAFLLGIVGLRRRFFRRRVPHFSLVLGEVRIFGRLAVCAQQLLRVQPQPLDGLLDPGPFFGEKFLALAFHQQVASAGVDEHAASPFGFDQSLVYE